MTNYDHHQHHHGSRRSRYNAKGTTPLPPLPMHQMVPPTSRTPGAWMLRDVNLSGSRPTSTLPHHPGSAAPFTGRYPSSTMAVSHGGGEMQQQQQMRPSSSATTSSDGEEVPMVRGPRRPASHLRGTPADRRSVMSRTSRVGAHQHLHHQHQQQPPPHAITYDLTGMTAGMVPSHYGPANGTLRSSRSVPALAMQPYEMPGGPSCPVHGHPVPAGHGGYPMHHQPIYDMGPAGLRRFGSMMDVRSMAAGPIAMVNYGTEKKSFVAYGPPHQSYHGGTMTLPRPPTAFFPGPPPHRQMMMQTFDPNFKLAATPMPTKMMRERPVVYEEAVCCKGHLIVLWIILAVVTIGVISGIILSVTMN